MNSLKNDDYSIIFDIWTKIGDQPIHLKSQAIGFLPKILEDDIPRLQLNVDFPGQFTRKFKTEMAKAENRGKQKCIQIIENMLEYGNEQNSLLKSVIEKLKQYEIKNN